MGASAIMAHAFFRLLVPPPPLSSFYRQRPARSHCVGGHSGFSWWKPGAQLLKKADDCELLRLRPWCPWWSEDIVQRVRALHEKPKREPGGGLQQQRV